ncbi:MbeD/MobD family mobilization/exclusion protein, partial [Pseudomonas aeruginosa]|uniref:MbeD/MobD family mobilization/exclusion protein n=1 Tax=Pseudomonas aeruginosa TaxID=287 RepID=UPI001DE5D0AD
MTELEKQLLSALEQLQQDYLSLIHISAHETGAYLVCRLLLEKKNEFHDFSSFVK